MIKFLADENIATSVINALLAVGYDIKKAGLANQGLGDESVFNLAAKENRIILTHDKDFGNILKYPLRKHRGVVLIRLKNQSPQNVVRFLIPFVRSHEKQLRNSLVILSEESIRFYKGSWG